MAQYEYAQIESRPFKVTPKSSPLVRAILAHAREFREKRDRLMTRQVLGR